MKKVLVVDDDRDIVEIVLTILKKNGFRALGRLSDFNLDETVREYKPDLILLDIRLSSEKSGTEICRELKKKFSFPVILFSAELKVVWKDCNADGFIHKPFDIEHLVSIVTSHININEK
jgi:two-component system response regulator VicR